MATSNSRLSRRKFLAGVAAGGVAVQLPAVLSAAETATAAAPTPATAIDANLLAAGEKLAGISFTPAQREPLVKTVSDRIPGYTALRTPPIPNDVFPALTFNLAIAGIRPPAGPVQRLGASYTPPKVARPTSDEDLAFLSVAQLAALLRQRRITSRALTELSLARLKKFDPTLQAVITVTEERALKQADAADAELKAGKWRGPLHGIPWGAKDLLAVRGYPTTWGAAAYQNQRFDYDAEVVRRLDAAGAVLVAKLTLGALANNDAWFGGQTKCPWNIANGSSGSSAGPSSAVSAGLVPFAIGSETLGSIVSPCTRNAVSGLRPTYGRVTRAGAMSLAWSMDKLGPIARTVEDCALIFDAIHGADPADPTAVDAPFAWQPRDNLRGQRVGFIASAFEQKNEWTDANQAALATLRQLGAELVAVEPPAAPAQTLRLILNVEAAAAFDDLTLSGGIDDVIAPRPSNWATTMRAARYIPAVEYVQANRLRTVLVREVEKLFAAARMDVWVSPFGGSTQLVLTNLTGHPTVCVPAGFQPVKDQPAESPRRNTTSLSFISRLYRDEHALAAAHAFQRATDFHNRRPPIA
jgi:Asp-tRNA(Asn)/Glu-tRNA(Gln) amidotransferase A subunit family amidase